MSDKISLGEHSFAPSDANPNLNLLDLSKAFKHRFQESNHPQEKPSSSDAPSKEEYDLYPDEVKQMAKRATEIITKTGHFGHYGKREEIKDIFADAADKGHHAVEQVINAVKFELKRRDAPYRIEGGYQTQTVTVNQPSLMYPPPQTYTLYTYTGADIKLINTGSKRTEDALTVRGKEISRVHYGNGILIPPSEENRQ